MIHSTLIINASAHQHAIAASSTCEDKQSVSDTGCYQVHFEAERKRPIQEALSNAPPVTGAQSVNSEGKPAQIKGRRSQSCDRGGGKPIHSATSNSACIWKRYWRASGRGRVVEEEFPSSLYPSPGFRRGFHYGSKRGDDRQEGCVHV